MLLRALLLFLLFLFVARAVWRLLEGILRGIGAAPPARSGRGSGGPAAVRMAQCPVCGTFVVPGKALTGVDKGAPVYFCSEACRARFAA